MFAITICSQQHGSRIIVAEEIFLLDGERPFYSLSVFLEKVNSIDPDCEYELYALSSAKFTMSHLPGNEATSFYAQTKTIREDKDRDSLESFRGAVRPMTRP